MTERMNKLRRYIFILLSTAVLAVALSCQAKQLATQVAEAESNAQPAPTPTPARPITIAAVGDVMLGSPFPNDTRMPPNDGADILKGVTPILSAADIAFGNMEGPIIDDGISEKCPPNSTRCFAFRMPTRYAK